MKIKKIIEEKEPLVETTDPIDEIILRGTKTTVQEPGGMNSPKTGEDNAFELYSALLILYGLILVFLGTKKRCSFE